MKVRPIIKFLLIAAIAAGLIYCSSSEKKEARNERIYWMEDSVSWVEVKDDKFGIVWEGQTVIEPVYEIERLEDAINLDGYCYFSDGAHFALGRDGKWGVINNRGRIIVPFEYDYLKLQRDDEADTMAFAGVEKNGKVAIMDGSGQLITGYDYEAFYGYYRVPYMLAREAKIIVKKADRIVFYDPLTKTELSRAPDVQFGEPSMYANYKGKWGLLSQDGKILVPVEFEELGPADLSDDSDLMIVGNNGKYGIWRITTRLVVPVEFERIEVERVSGMPYFAAAKGKRWGLYSSDGKSITGHEYDSLIFDSISIVGLKAGERVSIHRE